MAGKLSSTSSSPHQFLCCYAHLKQLLLSLLLLLLTCEFSESQTLQLSEEWHGWKVEHGKEYVSEREEVYRHVIWKSNKRFIEAHNLYNETFGYTLAMNEMGDLVRMTLASVGSTIEPPHKGPSIKRPLDSLHTKDNQNALSGLN